MSEEPLPGPPAATDPVTNTGNLVITGVTTGGTPMAGDVTGTAGANTVGMLQGKAIPVPGPADAGKVLSFNAGTNAYEWVAPTSGSVAVTNFPAVQPVSGTLQQAPLGAYAAPVLLSQLTQQALTFATPLKSIKARSDRYTLVWLNASNADPLLLRPGEWLELPFAGFTVTGLWYQAPDWTSQFARLEIIGEY